jgi:hypothetical protein
MGMALITALTSVARPALVMSFAFQDATFVTVTELIVNFFVWFQLVVHIFMFAIGSG